MKIPLLSQELVDRPIYCGGTLEPHPAEPAPPPNDQEQPAPPRRRRRGRRAVTSMEYVVMASFILLVVIGSVQTLGFSVASLFTSDAAATTKAWEAAQAAGS